MGREEAGVLGENQRLYWEMQTPRHQFKPDDSASIKFLLNKVYRRTIPLIAQAN